MYFIFNTSTLGQRPSVWTKTPFFVAMCQDFILDRTM